MKKKEDIKNNNEIKIVQWNPKFRSFLLIFFSWFCWFIYPILAILFLVFMPESWINPGHFYIFLIILGVWFLAFTIWLFFVNNSGIKYLPKDLLSHYLKKNHQQLGKIDYLEIENVTQMFKVAPICPETALKKPHPLINEKFKKLTYIEASNNRLVVNGKIDNLDFSWGIATRVQKKSWKVFWLSVLYFGPFYGIGVGIVGLRDLIWDDDAGRPGNPGVWVSTFHSNLFWKYRKTGGFDVFAAKVGKLNSENYLIFSAKLKSDNHWIHLVPKDNHLNLENLDSQSEWPATISETQKINLQNLMKGMDFLPRIYLEKNQISIIMKKYYYNEQDNQQLQTWELLKDPTIDGGIQFNYFQQAINIYQIFNV